MEDLAACGGEALRGVGQVGRVEAAASLVGVGVGVPVGVLFEDETEAILGNAEVVDGAVELLVAALHADHGASVVRLDGVEAAAEAGEQAAHAAEGLLDGGIGAFLVWRSARTRVSLCLSAGRKRSGRRPSS